MNKLNDSKILLESRKNMPLGRKNFIGMAVSVILIILGFLLMLGDSSTTEAYNPEIFNTRRVVIGPLIAFVGFVTMAISIILKPSGK